MKQVGDYDIEDVSKIQGRDEVYLYDRSLAGLRLSHALEALAETRGSVLVLGCGAGRYVRALSRVRTDLEVHGGDLSLTALREARERDARHHYVGLDASRLPYRNEVFDAVVFFDLLEHVPDYTGLLEDVERVLAPGGVLHLFVPLEGRRGTVYWMLRDSRRVPINRWKRDHVGHVNRFRAEDVLHAVWETGLEVTGIAYGFHAAGQLHDVVDYWQRERLSGAPGMLPPEAVRLLARATFIPTWRLSWLEDRLYSGPVLASGLHLTAHKSAPRTGN